MKYELYTRVALATDLPEHRLQRGDVATLVEFHTVGLGQEPGYSLEVFTATGGTIAVIAVPESKIRPLTSGEVLSIRLLSEAVSANE